MSDKKQKILSSKTVFKAKLFDVKEVHVEFPNKEKAVHHVVERRTAVYVFPLTSKNELYFVEEYNYTTEGIVLQVPAGFVEENESTLKAAKRELKEETGIVAGQWEEFGRLELAKSSLKAQASLFLAKDLEITEASPESTEDITVVKLTLDQAIKKAMSGEIRKAAVVAGILMLSELKRKKQL